MDFSVASAWWVHVTGRGSHMPYTEDRGPPALAVPCCSRRPHETLCQVGPMCPESCPPCTRRPLPAHSHSTVVSLAWKPAGRSPPGVSLRAWAGPSSAWAPAGLPQVAPPSPCGPALPHPQALSLTHSHHCLLRSLPVTNVDCRAPSSPGKLLPWPGPQSCGPPSGL